MQRFLEKMSPISKPITYSDFVWLLKPKVWSHLRGSQYASKSFFCSLLIGKQKKESYEATILEPWKLSITLIFTCFLRDTPWLLIHHTGGRWFFADSIYEGSKRWSSLSSFGILLRRFFEKWLIKNLSRRSLLSKCSTLSFQFAWNIHRDSISCD